MLPDIKSLEELVKNKISKKRYDHSKRVEKLALKLSQKYQVDLEKTIIAALLHDYAKGLEPKDLIRILQDSGVSLTDLELSDPEILHGPVGAIIAEREFAIKDKEILESIKYHTTAGMNLSDLAKIIYLADATEPDRQYPGIETIRKVAEEDLDQALLLSLNSTLSLLIKKGKLIHPLSIEARNSLIMKK